jgi:hypothetical protein
MLADLGTPSDVVETDYPSSTALFTGHRTSSLAFTNTLASCDLAALRFGLASDNASFLLLGDLNKPGVLDRPCIYRTATTSPGAVELLRTNRDRASVFELIGPGTGHPDLRDITRLAVTSRHAANGASVFEWDWTGSEPVTQVSVGAATARGPTTSVLLQIRDDRGGWRTVAASASAVGDGKGAAPYLLATPIGQEATGVRVVVIGPGPATVEDVHALGPVSPRAAAAARAPTGPASVK